MAKILVVDDDVHLVESMKALLEDKGHKVVSAQNGTEGYEKARSEKPNLILLDVMMVTDSEGFEVARKLHDDAQTKAIPVILITGIRRAKSLPFSFEPDEDWLPVKAVLEKPVKPEKLFKAIDEALK
jgi:two-component system, OmpR family, alkaline phosphatase synthesis response regulator PhoP